MDTNESTSPAGPLAGPLQQVNERCLTLLIQAARSAQADTFPLVLQLGSVLREVTPEVRTRAARRSFLLVDLELANGAWWRWVQNHPAREAPLGDRHGSFPRAAAIPLSRATLMLAWHAVRAHDQSLCLLGMSPTVAEIVGNLSLTEIDQVAVRRFRHLRPRWDDHPALWNQLLQSSQTSDIRLNREFCLRALALSAGVML